MTSILAMSAGIASAGLGEESDLGVDRFAAATEFESAIKAVVSGVDEGRVYGEIPPVMVELKGFERGTNLWVEVHRGTSVSGKPEMILTDAKKKIWWLDEVAVLNVPGLEKACKVKGTYTLSVRLQDRSATTTLAKTTFEVDGTGRPVEAGLVAAP